jgi:uncharacterized SAM-binding protein YcdF (DUF218 family)
MHAIASYILSLILSPLNWIIFLLVAAYFFNKRSFKKACRIAALCIFLVFSNQLLLDWYANKWQSKPLTIKPGSVYTCGIVLGGFAGPDANGNGYFNAAADRFIQALKLYKLGEIKNILISGGNGKDQDKNFREGAWVKTQLDIMGVPDSAILVEDRSNNTFDNAFYAKQILDSLKLKPPYLLITSAFHEPRAMLLFKNAGMSTIAFPANYTEGVAKFSISSLLPQVSVLMGWDSYLKEAAGFLFYKFRGNKY